MIDEHRLLFYNNNLCGQFLESSIQDQKKIDNFFSVNDPDFERLTDTKMSSETKQTFFTLLLEDSPPGLEGILDKR